ncbi:MAG: M24 family metallopeptidase, partial [Pseudobdellovibrionaceae bacterium]
DLCLKKEDIFFFDIGPIFENHEGDIGRTFSIGSNTEIKKCCEDAENIWWEVRDHWHHQGVSGRDLYKFAQSAADRRGWNLSLHEANGHRIADFPHAARARGTIEALELAPSADRWILEIQIRHPLKPFGAFYEDLLN